MRSNVDDFIQTQDQIQFKVDVPAFHHNSQFRVDQKVMLSENINLKEDRINEIYSSVL